VKSTREAGCKRHACKAASVYACNATRRHARCCSGTVASHYPRASCTCRVPCGGACTRACLLGTRVGDEEDKPEKTKRRGSLDRRGREEGWDRAVHACMPPSVSHTHTAPRSHACTPPIARRGMESSVAVVARAAHWLLFRPCVRVRVRARARTGLHA
jgi:hypothetical protein